MDYGLVIGRVFIGFLVLVTAFCVVKADAVARFTYKFRKKHWNLTEKSIPLLTFICRFWNGIMFFVLIYLFIFLPKFME